MSGEVLRISNLHAWYGESHILHGVDLVVQRGEVVTLLGRNGSGRTSTLKSILGMVGRRNGCIVVNGVETIALPSYRIVRLGIGYCPEERGIFASLSTEENLLLPPQVQWKAHNYNHLHEAPTVFYAVAILLAIVGAGDGINAQFAWIYVGLRVTHSIVQATISKVKLRFGIFALSSLVLMVLVARAAMAVL